MEKRDMATRALITGITGQDGSYLAELLLSQGYKVFGLVRHTSVNNLSRITHLLNKITLINGDISDQTSVENAIMRVLPDEMYHLACMSHVGISFKAPLYTHDVTAVATLKVLNAVKNCMPGIKLYNASTSEMYGDQGKQTIDENTPFAPNSPYAVGKLGAHLACKMFRDAYGMYICNGILFNHESPRRGELFVTRKISTSVANIYHGRQQFLSLGNLDISRDWGWAPDYVYAMWKMMQQAKGEDYVVGTGTSTSLRDFLAMAFNTVGLDYKNHTNISSQYVRPNDIAYLCANPTKAYQKLNWQPSKNINDIIKEMVTFDVERVRKEMMV